MALIAASSLVELSTEVLTEWRSELSERRVRGDITMSETMTLSKIDLVLSARRAIVEAAQALI